MHYVLKQRLTGMVKYMFIVFLFCSCSLMKAQSFKGVKVYAYRQAVAAALPSKGVIDESGREVNLPKKPAYNMWIYITAPPNTSLQPTELYIDDILYRLKTDTVNTTPVVHESAAMPGTSKQTILVPHTTGTVLLLTPAGRVTGTTGAAHKKLMTQNSVVVGYTIRGKKYYTPVQQMTPLTPAVMQ